MTTPAPSAEEREIPEQDLYDIASYVGVSADGMRRILGVLKLLKTTIYLTQRPVEKYAPR